MFLINIFIWFWMSILFGRRRRNPIDIMWRQRVITVRRRFVICVPAFLCAISRACCNRYLRRSIEAPPRCPYTNASPWKVEFPLRVFPLNALNRTAHTKNHFNITYHHQDENGITHISSPRHFGFKGAFMKKNIKRIVNIVVNRRNIHPRYLKEKNLRWEFPCWITMLYCGCGSIVLTKTPTTRTRRRKYNEFVDDDANDKDYDTWLNLKSENWKIYE